MSGFEEIVRIAFRAVPGRDLMSPPDLARDAPVLDILHPRKIGVGPSFGNDPNPSLAHGLDGGLGQRLDADEPLRRKAGFDDGLAAVAPA